MRNSFKNCRRRRTCGLGGADQQTRRSWRPTSASWDVGWTSALDRAVITTTVAKREAMLGWVAVLEGKGVELLVVPGALDYMAGTVRSTNLFGVPLVNLSHTGLGSGMKA